jgi:hypothetical protein
VSTPVHADFEHSWQATVLPGQPMIAPARHYVFPVAVPGEEDALARGALWLDVRPVGAPGFLAQCALGFAGAGVATGVWATPKPDTLLAVAGGYGYLIPTAAPDQTALLPLRPIVSVHAAAEALVLVGFHAITVISSEDQWQSERLSWEGVSITGIEGDMLHGLGWHMRTDRELPFTLNLRTRELTGGAFLP